MAAPLTPDEWMRLANGGSDIAWWTATAAEGEGFCGGCGGTECHPGTPCGDVRGFDHGVCDLCPTRVAEGQVAKVREVTP